MKTDQQLFEAVNSDLLDFTIDMLKEFDKDQFISRLGQLFLKHFNVSKIDLFPYRDNRFHHISHCCNDSNALRIGVGENKGSIDFEAHLADMQHLEDDTLMIRNDSRQPIAMMLVKSSERWNSFAESNYRKKFQLGLGRLIETVLESEALRRQAMHYRFLLEATKHFNSTLETHVIYEKLVKAVENNFPTVEIELILSQDNLHTTSPYRLFDYSNEIPSMVEAFLSGTMTVGRDQRKNSVILNSPIVGMQGTYGILQLTAPSSYVFTPSRKDFVGSISESAGHAIENSSLYNQSHRLVRDLQLVNEVSKKLTSRLTSEGMSTYISDRLLETFTPEEVALVHFQNDKKAVLSKGTTDYFFTDAGSRYMDYAEMAVKKEKEAVFIADLESGKIDGFSPYRSLIAVPIVTDDVISGIVVLMHTEKYHFSFDDFKLVKAIMNHFSLALSNLKLRERLQGLANKDQLTGLYARGYLDRHMAASFKKGLGGAFLLLDVDDFKLVNDRNGHAVGDRVLKQVSRLLQNSITERDTAGRWGGEEFAVYLPGADLLKGKRLAEKLVKQMPLVTNPSVTVSIGVSVWDTSFYKETYQQLFQLTDEALYKAKLNGKNQAVISRTVLTK